GPHSSPSYVSATPASYLQPLPSSPTPRSSDLDFADLAPQHMVANTVAAAALARAVDVPPAAIQQAIRGYALTAHRIQPVAKADDVLWVNDTKATNPHAAAAALESFTDVVWIAGGLA